MTRQVDDDDDDDDMVQSTCKCNEWTPTSFSLARGYINIGSFSCALYTLNCLQKLCFKIL